MTVDIIRTTKEETFSRGTLIVTVKRISQRIEVMQCPAH